MCFSSIHSNVAAQCMRVLSVEFAWSACASVDSLGPSHRPKKSTLG